MFALGIILAHLTGDYLIQSHWMATEKVKRWWPAIVHGATYSIPYAALMLWPINLTPFNPLALFVIGSTHVVIDRLRLAKHFAWLKNQLGPKGYRPIWSDAKATGYPPDTPAWMAVWLMIIADNTLHLLINTASLLCLRAV